MTEKFRLDGIHYKKGTIPNLPFDIYLQLDLAEPKKENKVVVKTNKPT